MKNGPFDSNIKTVLGYIGETLRLKKSLRAILREVLFRDPVETRRRAPDLIGMKI